MKIFLTLTLYFVHFTVTSQSWCDAGANWKYTFSSGFGAVGYTEIQYINDTVIAGQSAQVLDKHLHGFNYFGSQTIDFHIGEEYTYEDSGVVYLWYENNWDTLYNFNAAIGESWRMAKQPAVNACDSNSTLTVIDEGTKIINSISLNYKIVEFNYGTPMNWTFSDTLIEKIGFIGNYMFPYELCNSALDAIEGGVFRCYQDDNFATYKPHYSEECDFIVGMDENTLETDVKIVPNPSSENIQVIGLTMNSYYSIVDIYGKSHISGEYQNPIDISELPSGLYFLTLHFDKIERHIKFLKD